MAYSGSRGTTIPTPVTVMKMVKNMVIKIFLWGEGIREKFRFFSFNMAIHPEIITI
jgi:hypothetical protein